MMLPSCNLFPHCLLPLHIFEPRYREMLADALGKDRMFCIGTLTRPEQASSPDSCVHSASTAGFVRACVTQPDGCSNLLLQGVQRIHLSDFQTDRPYVTAAVGVIESVSTAPESLLQALVESVRRQALDLIEAGQMVSPNVRTYLEELKDPEILGDLIAYHFIRNPDERHPLLEQSCVVSRLQFLQRTLATHRRKPSDP